MSNYLGTIIPELPGVRRMAVAMCKSRCNMLIDIGNWTVYYTYKRYKRAAMQLVCKMQKELHARSMCSNRAACMADPAISVMAMAAFV
jgi:hypothetical protein